MAYRRGIGERKTWVKLTEWRTAVAGLSTRALDRLQVSNIRTREGRRDAPAWTEGTTAQLESGSMLPPDERRCEELEAKLNAARREAGMPLIPAGAVWEAAAEARLERLDPALLRWHRDKVDDARSFALTVDEEHLVDEVRQLGEGAAADLAQALGKVVAHRDDKLRWSTPRAVGEGLATNPDRAIGTLFHRLHRLQPADQVVAWRTFAGVVQALWARFAGSSGPYSADWSTALVTDDHTRPVPRERTGLTP